MNVSVFLAACLLAANAMAAGAKPKGPARHNVLIFVADGLRADSVNEKDAPTLARLRREGVNFTNPHALYPTLTTVNAAAIATGHYVGDTGNYGNQLYTGFPSPEAGGATTPFLESNAILGQMNEHFGGNYLHEESLLAAARKAGFQTAAFGKVGAAGIQDVTARDGTATIIVDDSTGTPGAIPVARSIAAAMKARGLRPTAPKNANPNIAQQRYLLDIATKIVLPKFKATRKPFVIVFWSRDPDVSQHSQKDSLGKLTPGINGPTGKAGIRNADDTLAALMAALKSLGLDRSTNVFVTADHGFSTINNRSKTSAAPRYWRVGKAISEPRNLASDLPQGFLAIDIADALKLPLFDPNAQKAVDYESGEHSSSGNGLIGTDPQNPDVIIAANGGSDEIWLPNENASDLVRTISRVLSEEDYVSGIFVNDDLGEVPGTLPLSAINLKGAARTPEPALVVSFRSAPIPGCTPEFLCAAEVADTSLFTGQGMHGTFSRADTKNFMAAKGPDFKNRFSDTAPVGNMDITPTFAQILHLPLNPRGRLIGRVLQEALPGGSRVSVTSGWVASPPAANALQTILNYQQVGGTRYVGAAGYPGRTVGLSTH
ncbi:MAG: alkaline phosphatase family protein [Alphaproteobacteria bacterium]|nr:alkaline phosphatase family protein [Alphaproteobacteria bacterium]